MMGLHNLSWLSPWAVAFTVLFQSEGALLGEGTAVEDLWTTTSN